MISAITAQLCDDVKGTLTDMLMHRCGYDPIKLYLQKKQWAHLAAVHSMVACVLVDCSHFIEKVPPNFSSPCIPVFLQLSSTSEYVKEPVEKVDAWDLPYTSKPDFQRWA